MMMDDDGDLDKIRDLVFGFGIFSEKSLERFLKKSNNKSKQLNKALRHSLGFKPHHDAPSINNLIPKLNHLDIKNWDDFFQNIKIESKFEKGKIHLIPLLKSKFKSPNIKDKNILSLITSRGLKIGKGFIWLEEEGKGNYKKIYKDTIPKSGDMYIINDTPRDIKYQTQKVRKNKLIVPAFFKLVWGSGLKNISPRHRAYELLTRGATIQYIDIYKEKIKIIVTGIKSSSSGGCYSPGDTVSFKKNEISNFIGRHKKTLPGIALCLDDVLKLINLGDRKDESPIVIINHAPNLDVNYFQAFIHNLIHKIYKSDKLKLRGLNHKNHNYKQWGCYGDKPSKGDLVKLEYQKHLVSKLQRLFSLGARISWVRFVNGDLEIKLVNFVGGVYGGAGEFHIFRWESENAKYMKFKIDKWFSEWGCYQIDYSGDLTKIIKSCGRGDKKLYIYKTRLDLRSVKNTL